MQIVYLSNRPETMLETLDYVDALMPFITEAVVVCPADQVEAYSRRGRVTTIVVNESSILGPFAKRFLDTSDHQARNLLLRCALADSDLIDDELIMSDDDSRPLKEVPPDTFKADGRHHAFFFHDLGRWNPAATDYDRGQHATAEALQRRGLKTLSYSSHMPQIICTAHLRGMVDHFADELAAARPLDEWSLYFNYAMAQAPEMFHAPRPFVTLCWPALPTDWELDVRPGAFEFENFYPALYEPGHLFAGIPTAFSHEDHARNAATKIARRGAAQRNYDSRRARLHRRGTWLLYRTLQRADRVASRFPRIKNALESVAPRTLQRRAADILENGSDPAFWVSYDRCPGPR